MCAFFGGEIAFCLSLFLNFSLKIGVKKAKQTKSCYSVLFLLLSLNPAQGSQGLLLQHVHFR
jgi:hypothetical protein